MESKVFKLNLVEALNGYFFNIANSTAWNHDSLMIGDKPLVRAHKPGWYVCDHIPEKFTRRYKGPSTNHRFELKPEVSDSVITALGLKQVMEKEDCLDLEASGCHYDHVWREEYKMISTFYEYKYDTPEDIEEIAVDANIVLKIDAPIGESVFSYKVYRTQWDHEGTKNLVASDIKTAFEYSLLYPNIVNEYLPCSLTAKESYDIVRMYIQENIDPKVAYISSDYDFCLAVKKKIKLHQEAIYLKEVKTASGRSYKNKKYREVYITNREVPVYEVAPAAYQKYPVMVPFVGNSHEDLKMKIDSYLKKLIEEINTPLIDCPHCQGMGVVVHEE